MYWKNVKIKRSFRQIQMEKFFRTSLVLIALSILILVICLFTYVDCSVNAFNKGTWDLVFYLAKHGIPLANIYGTYPFLLGTLLTSFLALLYQYHFHLQLRFFWVNIIHGAGSLNF